MRCLSSLSLPRENKCSFVLGILTTTFLSEPLSNSNETFILLFIFQLKLEFLLLRVCGGFKFCDAVREFPRFIISSVDVLMPIFFFCIFVSIKCLLSVMNKRSRCILTVVEFSFTFDVSQKTFHNLLCRPMLINVRRLSSLNCIFVSLSWNLWFSVLGFPSYYQERT